MSATIRLENFKDFTSQLKIIKLIDSWDKADVFLSKENKFSTSGKITKQKKMKLLFLELYLFYKETG